MSRYTIAYTLYSDEVVYPTGPYDLAAHEAEGYTKDTAEAFTWDTREAADADDLRCRPHVVGADPRLTQSATIIEV